MKRFAILLFALSFSIAAFSQFDEKIKTEGVVTGVIIKEGKEIVGYIKKTGTVSENGKTYSAPWQFQSGIKFIEKDAFENAEKLKNKDYASYGPKDCEGFRYDNDSFVYESVKYSDTSQGLDFSTIPKQIFLRKISDDKISLFEYFNNPPTVTVGSEGFGPDYIECAEPNLLYRKGTDGKIKLVQNLNIKKELADCQHVTQKQANGEYKVVGKEGAGSKLSKLINNTNFAEEVRIMAISDYNAYCK